MRAIERESVRARVRLFPFQVNFLIGQNGEEQQNTMGGTLSSLLCMISARNIQEEKAQAPEGPRAVVGLLFGGWAIFGRNGIGRISTLSSLSYDYNTVLCALLLYQTPSLSPSPSTSQH